MTTQEFGRLMKQTRKAMGLSQKAFAMQIGRSWAFVALVETQNYPHQIKKEVIEKLEALR